MRYFIKESIYRLITLLLNEIFPQPRAILKIEQMSAADFSDAASRPLDPPISSPHLLCLYSLFNYKDPLVQQALWELKYRGNQRIAELFASLIYDELIEKLSDMSLYDNFELPLLIPLPLSRERLRERGWNQSEMIAQSLKKLDNNQTFTMCLDALKKIRHTSSQTKLSKAKRLKNLHGCFIVQNLRQLKTEISFYSMMLRRPAARSKKQLRP
jgi:predicted amidophosphoribosyltransferase